MVLLEWRYQVALWETDSLHDIAGTSLVPTILSHAPFIHGSE